MNYFVKLSGLKKKFRSPLRVKSNENHFAENNQSWLYEISPMSSTSGIRILRQRQFTLWR